MSVSIASIGVPRSGFSRICIFCEYNTFSTYARPIRDIGRVQRRHASYNGSVKDIRPTSRPALKSIAIPLKALNQRVCRFRSAARISLPAAQEKPSSTEPTASKGSRPDPTQIVRPEKPNRPHVRAIDGELEPAPLSRPLGLPHPPQPGQNTGVDDRGWRQRRDDFVSYDKHLERRKGLMKDLYEKNYFRDIGNLGKIHKGKSILAPPTPFRKDVALYFPNIRGRTLVKGVSADTEDITPVLRGRVSVVCVLNSQWAELQTKTFVGEKEGQNPEIARILNSQGSSETAQMVTINVETNWLKWGLIRMFFGRLRRSMAESQWAKYFLIRRGLTEDIKDAMGIWNIKVGYVYLVDPMCRVRWAGNGDARDDEKKNLVNCLKRLINEANGVAKPQVTRHERTQTSETKKPSVERQPAFAAGA